MNLCDEAQSLLLYQWRNSSKLKALLRGLVRPLQEVLEQVELLDEGRYIDEAYGKRLDIIGRIVNQHRDGRDDESYKAWLKVRIRLNIGHGRAEDVLGILGILLKERTYLLHEQKPDYVMITLLDEPEILLKPLFDIIKAACPVSTRCRFKRATSKNLFRFDGTPFGGHLAEFYEENI